jgi:hypothetical protein
MIITNSSHVGNQNEKYQHVNIYNYKDLLDSLSVLDPKKWPTFKNGKVKNIQFRDDK